MEWQAIVLAVQILLLAAGWLLFQRARGELSVRASEAPVLGEVKALQNNVKQLLAEIETTADTQSARLEHVCADAVSILAAIESRIQDAEAVLAHLEDRVAEETTRVEGAPRQRNGCLEIAAGSSLNTGPQHAVHTVRQGQDIPAPKSTGAVGGLNDRILARRETVYAMADDGQSSATIAHATRLSEGEIEALLGLRIRR